MSSLSVASYGATADAVAAVVPELVTRSFASKLFAQDATLWGPDAEAEASIRLSWVGLPRSSRPLVGEIAALRDHLHEQGLTRVVLCGMGGSSLAPEVMCASAGVELHVLDSSQPDAVRSALTDLARTVVVVSSKSGSTVETDSQRRAFEGAFTQAGLDPAEHIVIVTDPGSPLDEQSRQAGYRVVNADPNVGGRYSALTAFGLVPSGLAGVDIEALLDEAEAVADLLASDDDANPALRLGAALAATTPRRDKALLVDDGTPIVGFGDWAEQLIAESTGKHGTGVLPVVVGTDPVEAPAADLTVVLVTDDGLDEPPSASLGDAVVVVGGTLGAQLLLWEAACAVAGALLGINPFDQPDVESAKAAARELLDAGSGSDAPPDFVDGAVAVRSLGGLSVAGLASVEDAVSALIAHLDPDTGYLAIMAFLDSQSAGELAGVRASLAASLKRPVTFGWGPRFLHSTGQYHKGGPPEGVYLQITADPVEDLPVPGREFSFGEFIAAQAAGDAQVLASRGRPVLRLHLPAGGASVAELTRRLNDIAAHHGN